MPNFYAGQTDYIDKLNELATANELVVISDSLVELDASVAAAAAAATTATTKAGDASTFATNAAGSATTATTKATEAATSATTAAAQATTSTNKAAEATAAAVGAQNIVLGVDTLYPTIRPSLNLDFVNSDSIDPRITCTRNSIATRTNKKGLVEIIPANVPRIDFDPVTGECKGLLIEGQGTNLLSYSENFDNAAWGKVATTVAPNATTAPDGTLTADKLVESSVGTVAHYVGINFTTTATDYTLTVYAKAGGRTKFEIVATSDNRSVAFDLSTGLLTSLSGYAGLAGTGSMEALADGWYRCRCTWAATEVSNGLRIALRDGTSYSYLGDGTSGVYIWGAQLEAGSTPSTYIPSTDTFTGRASTATYYNSLGQIAVAASGVARMNYNPANLKVAPKLLLEGAGTNLLLNSATLVTQNVTVTAVTHTLSFFGTGTVTLSGVATGTLTGTAVANRVQLTFTPTAGTLVVTVAGSCTEGQLEIGYMTSYIPTTTAAVTRAADTSTSSGTTRLADVAKIDGQNFRDFYRQDEGSFVITHIAGGTRISQELLNVSNGTSAEAIQLRYSSTSLAQYAITDGGALLAGPAPSGYATAGNTYCRAVAYKQDYAAQSINGSVASTDTSCTIPTVDRMYLGSTAAGNGGNSINGTIKSLRYYPKALTAAQLQALSTQ